MRVALVLLSVVAAAPAVADVSSVGEVLIVAGDGVAARDEDGRVRLTDDGLAAAARRVLAALGDGFETITLFTTFDDAGLEGASAYARVVRNEVAGIGLPRSDESARFGSAGTLRVVAHLGTFGLRAGDERAGWDPVLRVWAQETSHRFAAYLRVRDPRSGVSTDALLGRGCAHWGRFVDTQASVHDGFAWRDNRDGTFTATGARERFGELDLYAMGLLRADDVRPFFFLDAVEGIARPSCTDYERTALPTAATVRATRVDVSIADVIAANGARDPAAGPSSVREAVMVVTRPGEPPSAAVPTALAARLDRARLWWEEFARAASGSRLNVCTKTSAPCVAQTATAGGCSSVGGSADGWQWPLLLAGLTLCVRRRRENVTRSTRSACTVSHAQAKWVLRSPRKDLE